MRGGKGREEKNHDTKLRPTVQIKTFSHPERIWVTITFMKMAHIRWTMYYSRHFSHINVLNPHNSFIIPILQLRKWAQKNFALAHGNTLGELGFQPRWSVSGSGSPTWANIGITGRACSNTDDWVPPSECLIKQVWDGAQECLFLMSAQVRLLLLVEGLQFWTTLVYDSTVNHLITLPRSASCKILHWPLHNLKIKHRCLLKTHRAFRDLALVSFLISSPSGTLHSLHIHPPKLFSISECTRSSLWLLSVFAIPSV